MDTKETTAQKRAHVGELMNAAQTFAEAAQAVLDVWDRARYIEVEGYPAHWPSFEELTAEAWAWVRALAKQAGR